MRKIIFISGAFIAASLIFSVYSLANRRNTIITRETQIAKKLLIPRQSIRKFNPKRLSSDQVFIRIHPRLMRVDPRDMGKFSTITSREIKQIDYISSRCSGDAPHIKSLMDKQRLGALYEFDSSLFTRDIQWRDLVQSDCQFDYQTRSWIHGFLFTLGPYLKMNRLRYEYAVKNEFTEGDFLTEAKAFNAAASPKPPASFRSGSVSRMSFDRKRLKRTKNGYILRFNQGIIPTPTIAEGKLYISGGFNSSSYYAFNPNNGRNIWAISLSDSGPTGAAHFSRTIIFNTYSCTLFAISAANGKHQWSHFLGNIMVGTPSIRGNKVFTSYPSGIYTEGGKKEGPTHVLACFDLKTGKINWQKWIDSELLSAPLVENNKIIAATFSGTIYSLSESSGSILNAHRVRATSVPVLFRKRLLFSKRVDGKSDGKVIEGFSLFDPAKSEVLYKEKGEASPHLDRTIRGEVQGAYGLAHIEPAFVNLARKNIFDMMGFQGARIAMYNKTAICVSGNEIVAFDAESGERAWKISLPKKAKITKEPVLGTAASLASTFAFVGTSDGRVLQIDIAAGAIKKTYSIGEAVYFQPLIYKGKIFVTTDKGNLVCVDTKDRRLTGWTSWGGDSARTGSINR
ncbi:MAG: PQQ-binding-like beta-propeller repeat protein [bacterium]|nr:PQQ-binding-like beta-propeller repeat protein [bacterium]